MERVKINLNGTVQNNVDILVDSAFYYDYLNTVVINPHFIDERPNIGDEIVIYEYYGTEVTEALEYVCESGDVVENYTAISEEPIMGGIYHVLVTAITETGIQGSTYDDLSSLLSNMTDDPYQMIDDSDVTHYVRYCIIKNYRSVTIPLSVNEDFKGINSEASIEQIISDSVNGIIPDVIDMEKLKYSPYFSGETSGMVTGITFKLHFLNRTNDSVRKNFTPISKSWCSGTYLTVDTMSESDDSHTATLLGRLGFTDGDVYYRKNKLAKSFIRLSFYKTNDPITNALLYYSTIFVDAGELYGEYVNLERVSGNHIADEYDLVLNDGADGNRLDAEFTVTSEYDETRSTEGFNIYLFSSDRDMRDADGEGGEKPYKTIYMKVEFNHAGYGKTIQFVRPEGSPEALTEVEEYFNAVYIPIKVWYEEEVGKYVYSFDEERCYYDPETKRIYMDLYEAVLNDDGEGE